MSREQFERWFEMLVIPPDVLTGSMDQDARVAAIRRFTQEAWQAARAVPVKLPEHRKMSEWESNSCVAYNKAIDASAEAIRQAGYPVEGDA
jgi:hypothetical protein